ncbi:MAG: hypothetical protein IPG54_14010 [Sphingomonadales bacterium]|jgi:hypothetical protein|nr:hypothetical protein [Sphingomonadales bacterium]MBK9005054.1 hypothetical protein [Sphingomonadales bacterium]MBK9267212.1 hypothetical protein [Sphingomonadales bacterium]
MADDQALPRTTRRAVLGGMTLSTLALGGGMASKTLAQTVGLGGFIPRHWYEHDYRIVQTNLREIDALESPREIARAVKDFGGNVIVSNIGGIIAFYPTDLQYHYKNPYLKGDFVGEMIEASHANGMAYLGRFDLAKGMKPAFDAHPEWFSLRRDGLPREYNGTYQACPNGQWMQEYGIEILKEALTRYKPDGVFFNGVYFPSTNWYNSKPEGNCTCDNCRRAFKAMYNRDLPKVDDATDPAWVDYQNFQRRVLATLQQKIDAATAPLLQGAPIMGRAVVGRGELQRSVHRPAPEWPYQGGEQSRQYLAANPGKPWSATSATFVDFYWRQITETAANHELRLAQVMGVGGKLDLYLMGTLAGQKEPTWLPPVSRLFKWRAANAAGYEGMTINSRVGLYDSGATRAITGGSDFFGGFDTPFRKYQLGATRGAYMMLVDSRIPFQLVNDARVADGKTSLAGKFDVLLLPNTMVLSAAEAEAIDAFVEGGGLLIATGRPGSYGPDGKPVVAVPLASLPTMRYDEPLDGEGWSLDPEKGALAVTGRVPIEANYYVGMIREGTSDLIPFAPDQRYGPPEFSYAPPNATTRKIPGVAVRSHGKGHAVHIPWHIDWMYHRDSLPVHQEIIAKLIERYAPAPEFVLVGDGAVELMQMGRQNGQSLVHIINYAGQRNGRYNVPPKLANLRLGVKGVSGTARALVAGVPLDGTMSNGRTWYDLPPLGAFEAILV